MRRLAVVLAFALAGTGCIATPDVALTQQDMVVTAVQPVAVPIDLASAYGLTEDWTPGLAVEATGAEDE